MDQNVQKCKFQALCVWHCGLHCIYTHSVSGLGGAGPAPAIPELGINPYQWGTECLSGDVDAGPATSFPQSIGLVSARQRVVLLVFSPHLGSNI